MKNHNLRFKLTIAALSLFTLGLIIIGGCATKPPTAFEQRWFDITTNYFPQVVIKTNLQGVTEFRTNVVEQYAYSPGSGAKEIGEIGGAVGNIFGVGGLVSTGLAGLFGLWAQLRSSRRYRTAGSLAQTVETLRTFIKTLPNGAAYDGVFVQFMQSKQAEAGVLQEVVALLEREVSNPDAKQAVENVQSLITALRSQTP